MAKKKINSGNKIRRGTSNSALTPGSEKQQSLFEEIIGSAVDKIIQRLEDNEDVMSDIYSEITGLHKWSLDNAIENLTWHLNDKMTAVLGALYGTTQATADMTSSQWLSKLGKPLAGKEICAGVIDKLDSILSAIEVIGSVSPNVSTTQQKTSYNINVDFKGIDDKQIGALSDLFSIFGNSSKTIKNIPDDKTISNFNNFVKKLGDVVINAKNIGVTKADVTKINNTSEFLKGIIACTRISSNDIDNASSVLREFIKMTEKPTMMTALHLSNRGLIWQIITNVLNAANEVKGSGFKSIEGIGSFFSSIIDITRTIDKKDLKKTIRNIELLNTIVDHDHLWSVIENIKNINISKNDINNISNIIKFLKATGSIDDAINISTIVSLGAKAFAGQIAFTLLLYAIGSIDKAAEKAKKSSKNIKTIGSFVDSIINSLGDNRLQTVSSIINDLFNINVSLIGIAITGPLAAIGITSISKTLKGISDAVNIINDFGNINDINKKLDGISTTIGELSKSSVALATMAVTGPLAAMGAGMLLLNMKLVEKIVGKVNDLDIKDETEKNAKAIAILVTVCGGIMIIGALVGTYVAANIGSYVTFTVALSVFILGVLGALNLATRGMEDAKVHAEEFAKLLAISGGIMLVGGTIMTMFPELIIGSIEFAVSLGAFILFVVGAYALVSKIDFNESLKNIEDLMLLISGSAAIMLIGGGLFISNPQLIGGTFIFGVMLIGFIGWVTSAYNDNSKGIDKSLKYAKEFAALIAISGATLLIGGSMLVDNPSLAIGIIGFGFLLTVFILAVTWAYSKNSKNINSSTDSALGLALLIGISTLTMMVGAAFIENGKDAWNAFLFGAALSGFILMVTFAYSVGTWLAKDGLENANSLMKLIIVSAATLAIGGALMLIDGMPEAIKDFAIVLGAFILAVSLSIGVFAKLAKDALPAVITLTVMIALTSTILLTAGMLMIQNEGLQDAINGFALTSVIMIGVMAAIVGILGLIPKNKLKVGLKTLFVISVVIDSMVYTFTKLASISDKINMDNVWGMLGAMGAAVVAALVIVAIITGVMTIPVIGKLGAGAIAAAEGLLAGIILIIDMTADAMVRIAEASNAWANMKIPDTKRIVGGISAFVSLSASFAPLANPLIAIEVNAARSTVSAISSMLSQIAKGIQDMASLSIPEYDENGKVIGRRNLKPEDFTEAASNILTIVTFLGTTIISLYKDNENIFSDCSSWYERGNKTPFGLVVQSVSGLGKMISEIAQGVKDFANLRINEYDSTGKITGSRKMDINDFVEAGFNISLIVTFLGTTVTSLYKGNESMFTDSSSWYERGNKTPFGLVVKSVSGLGKMISNIAQGVKDFANLRINEYDSTGKITGSRKMSALDFIEAGFNISLILLTLGRAVETTYNKHKKLFADPILWGDSPFGMVKKSMTGVSELIMSAANAVKAINELDFVKLGLYNEKTGVKSKIIRLLTAVSSSINSIFESNEFKNIDEDNITLFDSIVTSYAKGIKSITGSLKNIPNDYTKYDNFVKGLSAINIEITKIPDLNRFNQQAKTMDSYVKTINSLQTNKIDKLISLSDSIMKMSEQLGSLDEFTDVLANKVTVVLAELSERMEESSSTIKTAEKVQTSRHKKINEALAAIKNLLAKPLNVNVTHKALTESPAGNPPLGTNGESTPTQTTGGGQPSNLENFVTYSGLAQNNTPAETASVPAQDTSMSEQRMKEIAKREVTRGINEYEARKDKRRGR